MHIERIPTKITIDGKSMKKLEEGKSGGWHYDAPQKELHLQLETLTNKDVQITVEL